MIHASSPFDKPPTARAARSDSSSSSPPPLAAQLQQQVTVSASSSLSTSLSNTKVMPASFSTGAESEPKRSRPRQGKLTAKSNHRLYAEHNYQDYADAVDTNTTDAVVPRKVGGGVSIPFPVKLYDVLDCIQREGKYEHIVSWQPHGRCFLIKSPKAFVAEVLPLYFRHSKLTSFQRQLNLYGFGRITIGPDTGSYYHQLFLRGKRFLAWHMPRTRVKGTKIKFASNPDAEPNFYKMPYLPDPYETPIATTKTPSYPQHDSQPRRESYFYDDDHDLSVANLLPVPPDVMLAHSHHRTPTSSEEDENEDQDSNTDDKAVPGHHDHEDDKKDFLARVLLMMAKQPHHRVDSTKSGDE